MQHHEEHADYLVLAGSNLFGYATSESDTDLFGFVVPSITVELDFLNAFEQTIHQDDEVDYKVYSLKKFVKLLLRSDIQCLESLFAPLENVQRCTSTAEYLLNHRSLFVTKSCYKRFSGYAYSELRKIRGVALKPVKQTPTQRKVVDQIREAFGLNKKAMDDVLEILYAKKQKKEVSVFRQLGKARKESIEKHGYSTKNAANCIRLLMEGVELMSTGFIEFPLAEEKLEIVRGLRSGKFSLKEVEDLFHHWDEKLKTEGERSDLPEAIDERRVKKIYLDIMLSRYDANST